MSIVLSHEPFVRWHLWQPCYFEVHVWFSCKQERCSFPIRHWVKVSESILSPMEATTLYNWVPTRYEPAGTSVTV